MTLPAGAVQTVLGPIEPATLGVVMPHEHLFVDLTCMFDPPTEASDRSRAYAPFSLEHLGWIRTHYFRHHPNLTLDDEELAAHEVRLYKAAGGSTIVDVSTRASAATRSRSRACHGRPACTSSWRPASTSPRRIRRRSPR